MNPADYILPLDNVRARFPYTLVDTPEMQAIVAACADKLGVTDLVKGIEYSITNTSGDDFEMGMVTLTVSRFVER